MFLSWRKCVHLKQLYVNPVLILGQGFIFLECKNDIGVILQ